MKQPFRTGYVVQSLEAALWAFHRSSSFEEDCLLAVNLGDDADTTGAVYGQLAGAFYGEEGIPEKWRSWLAKRELIEELAGRLYEFGTGERTFSIIWGRGTASRLPLRATARVRPYILYTWDETRTRGGTYNLVAEVGEGTGKITQFTLPFGAEFAGQPLTGTVPFSVTFTDLSTPWGWVENWQWNFGDGSPTITDTNPSHIYARPGVYTVTLTTTVGLSTYMEIKPNYLTATAKPK
jgi:hypothetical protein